MKKLIIALLFIATAIITQAEVIELGQTLAWTITATQAEYAVTNYDTTTGDWTINVQILLVSPLNRRTHEGAHIDVSTYYQCVVTGVEIATFLGVEQGTVADNFTGRQIDIAVKTIAFTKTLAAYGVSQ